MTNANMPNTKNTISLALIILIASIALNGLLAGLLIAKNNPNHPHMASPKLHARMHMPNDPRKLLGELTHTRRKDVMKATLQHLGVNGRKQHHQLMKNIRKARRSVTTQMNVDPIDAAALQQSMNDLVKARSALNEASNAFTLAILQELTPKERKAALKSMHKPRHERKRPGRRD